MNTVAMPTLKFLQTVEMGELPGIVPEEKFRVGEVDGVKIIAVNPDFQMLFFGEPEKSKGRATKAFCFAFVHIHETDKTLRWHKTLPALKNPPGIALSHFWELLKKQGTGQAEGPLNGKHKEYSGGDLNVALIPDWDGDMWMIGFRYFSDESKDGWYIHFCVPCREDGNSLNQSDGAWSENTRFISL